MNENKLPDYEVVFDKSRDMVIFKNRNPYVYKAQKLENLKTAKKTI